MDKASRNEEDKHNLQKYDRMSHLASGDMLTKGLKVSCKYSSVGICRNKKNKAFD